MHDLVPIVMFISLFGLLFGVYYLRTRENLAMLEKGLDPRDKAQSFTVLKLAMLLIGAGLGLFIAYMYDINMPRQGLSIGDNLPIYFASIGVFGGIGLLVAYFIERKQLNKKNKQ